MMGKYEIFEKGKPVGWAEVVRSGLYYDFSCQCQISGKYELMVSCGGKEHNLGLCVPDKGLFGTRKRLPVKSFETGKPQFYLKPREERRVPGFVSVYPEEPFSYMLKLKDAYLARQENEVGIVFKDPK